MTLILLTQRPNWLIPMFRQTGLIIEFKRFPADYMWRPFLDLSSLEFDTTDLDAAIAALDMSVTDLYDMMDLVEADITALYSSVTALNTNVAAAQADATTAISNAADAQSAADAAQATADAALAAAGAGANVYPTHHTITPDQFRTITGGFSAASYNTAFWLNLFHLMTGLNSEVELDVLLAAGDYAFSILWTKSNSSGDLTLKIDGTNVSTKVGYNATNLNAVDTWTKTGLAAGSHTLNLKVNAHTSPSSAYNIAASLFTIRKI